MKLFIYLLVLCPMFVIGCSHELPPPPTDRVSKANFEAIHNGMSTADVILLLGRWDPSDTGAAVKTGGKDAGVERRKWKIAGAEIDVDFVDDKVVSKSASGF